MNEATRQLFDLTGRVIRTQPPGGDTDVMPGMGLEFVDIDEEKKSRLARFVDRLRAELPDAAPTKPSKK